MRAALVLCLCLLATPGLAEHETLDLLDDCLLKQLRLSPANTPVADILETCKKQAEVSPLAEEVGGEPELPGGSPVIGRLESEMDAGHNPFLITPHKPNFVLPLTYNTTPNEEPFGQEEGALNKLEMKFQLSIKIPMTRRPLFWNSRLYAAYTGLSFWQAYNSKFSSPFRETNHEPEIFLLIPQNRQIFGWTHRAIVLGANHQSNGRTGTLSRSWNRLYANFIFDRDNKVVSLKPWYRIPEHEKTDPSDSSGDDNPDILDYMGYGEFAMFLKYPHSTFGLLLRNNFKEDNKGAVELSWSFPLARRFGSTLKGYIKYFNGYGESLIDYDARVNRLGIGVAINDWL